MKSKNEYLGWGYYKLNYYVLVKQGKNTSVNHFMLIYEPYTISLDGGQSSKRN
jgi:hypothetical protein